jgi:ADP-heptose:LPS heptosyltransferase
MPCRFHKEHGVECPACDHYQTAQHKILIIKLDALGDVLRTTCILPPLGRHYPHACVSWCTRTSARDLFINNDLVHDLFFIDEDAHFRLAVESFDWVINLDTAKTSASIATCAHGKKKTGFLLHEKGYIYATNDAARSWLEMSGFDDVKKKNTKTYQQIVYEILDLNDEIAPPMFPLTQTEQGFTRTYRKKHKLQDKPVIGLNTGSGLRWPNKSWPVSNWVRFLKLLDFTGYHVILLGGTDEKEINEHLASEFPQVLNTGADNSIRQFGCIVNACDVVITGDTFALHVATALQKKIIALFGPTSMDEIHLYDRGIKIRADSDCICCYNKVCTESISCMEKIKPEYVLDKLHDIL